MMFKYFLIALAFLYLGINQATAQTLCFKSEKIKDKCIRLQLTLPDEGSKLGKIKYENGSNEIGIQRVKEHILSGSKTIPATVRTEFAEIVDGKRVGTYLLVTQGAVVGELTYKQLRKKKFYKFYDDPDSYINDSCSWMDKNQIPQDFHPRKTE